MPARSKNPATPRPRSRRKLVLRLGLLLLLGAVVTPLAVLWWYTRPAQLIPLVEEALAEATGCNATVQNARVTTSGEITLEGVTLTVPGVKGEFATLLTAERIEMAGEARGLIDGSYRPKRIELIKPVLHLVENIDTGRFNYELLQSPESESDQPIPRVLITDGQIRFEQLIPGQGVQPLGEMGVAGELKPDGSGPKAYAFAIAETDAPDGTENIAFTGGFDLSVPSLDLRADHFRFEDEQRYFVPTGFRRWWSRLAPSGAVPELKIALGPDDQGSLDLEAVNLRYENVGFNLDVLNISDPDQEEIALLLKLIRTRPAGQHGEVVIKNDRFNITGRGTIQQSGIRLTPINYDLTVSGGLNEDDPVKATLQTQPFTLSDRYQFVLALSPLTSEGYRRFKPSGDFVLKAEFNAPGGDAPTDWTIDLDVLEGKMTHSMFPLPLEKVKGPVRITPEAVTIGPMTGSGVHGGTVVLTGSAVPPSDTARVELDIRISDLPINDALREALEPDVRDNMARFFDRERYEKLIERGLITTDAGDADKAPRFRLGGEVDVRVAVLRPEGEDQDYSVTPTIQAKGLSIMMRDFPYPLTADRGQIVVGRDFVHITGLDLTGPTGGGLTLNGEANKGADGEYRPQVRVTDAQLPIDPLLLSSIGEEAESLLTDLGISGVLSVRGKVFQDDDAQEPDLALEVGVANGTATPYGGRVTVAGVAGSFKLRAEGLDQLDLTGQRGDTKVNITGSVDWSDDAGGASADLTFKTTDTPWEAELIDVLPTESELRAQLTELYEVYQPAGIFDATLNWQPRPDDEPDGFVAKVTPKQMALNLLGGRLSFTQMTGSATVFADLMQLNELEGRFSDAGGASGWLRASGDIGFDDDPVIRLSLAGESDAPGETTRLLLPDAAGSVLDSIQYTGPLSVEQGELVITDTGSEAQTTDFKGLFKLDGVGMTIGGLPVTDFKGKLDVKVTGEPGEELPAMSYELWADSLLAKDRKVERFRIEADNTRDRNVLRSGRGTGSVYGGSAVLEASADLFAEGEVRLNASLHDVELAPLLKPEEHPQGHEDLRLIEREMESGLISASLALDSSYASDGLRSGRGSIRFRDAGLLADTPLELWLVQALNLNIPDQRGFRKGGAEFDVQGKRVYIDSMWMDTVGRSLEISGIRLFQQGLRIAGSGTMTYPDMALDLRLRTEITGSAEAVPFSELLRLLRNELVGIQVGGTLNDPEVTYRVLRDTRSAWEDLLKKPDARDQD